MNFKKNITKINFFEAFRLTDLCSRLIEMTKTKQAKNPLHNSHQFLDILLYLEQARHF